jgi:hypothetical protein
MGTNISSLSEDKGSLSEQGNSDNESDEDSDSESLDSEEED